MSGFWKALFLERQGSATHARVSSAFLLWNTQIPRRLNWKSALSALEPLNSWTTRDVKSLPSIFSWQVNTCKSWLKWELGKFFLIFLIFKENGSSDGESPHQRRGQCQGRTCVVWGPLSSRYPPGTLVGLCFFWLGDHLVTTWQLFYCTILCK